MAVDPVRKLALRLSNLEHEMRAVATQPQLAYSSVEDGAIGVNIDDQPTMQIGLQYDGTSAPAVVAGPTPPIPTLPMVTPLPGALSIYWDGSFADGSVAPMDFSRVTIHAVPSDIFDSGFPAAFDQRYIVGTFDHATGGEDSVNLDSGDYVVYFHSWTLAGKYSDPSDVATGTPAPAAGGMTPVISDTAPESPEDGQIWVDTALTPQATFIWDDTSSTWVATDATAQAIAASAAHVTTGTTEPISPTQGDLWYDTTDSPAAAKIWNGTDWVPVDASAAAAASQAFTLAGQKAKISVGTVAPTGPAAGDMWVDTTATPNAVKTWTGAAWVAVDAVSQSIAQGKTQTFTQGTVPTKANVNDLWNDTSVTPQVTRICTAAYSSGGTVASNWGKTVSDAVAQTIANGKSKTTIGSSAPSSPATGDHWVDITTTPATIKTWNGSAWTAAGDAAATATANSAASDAADALTAADDASAAVASKSSITVGSSAPSTPASGDIWYDISTTPAAAKVWDGSAWQPADAAALSSAGAALTAAGAAQNSASNNATRLDNLSVSDLKTGTLQADVEVAGALIVAAGDGTKNTITVDPDGGITVTDPNGNTLVNLPTDPGLPNSFNGQVTAVGLTATGSVQLQGSQVEISTSSTMTLRNGVTPPAAAPTAVTNYVDSVSGVPTTTFPTIGTSSQDGMLSLQAKTGSSSMGIFIAGYNSSNVWSAKTLYTANPLTTAMSAGVVPTGITNWLNLGLNAAVAFGNYGLTPYAFPSFVMVGTTCFWTFDAAGFTNGNVTNGNHLWLVKWTHNGSSATWIDMGNPVYTDGDGNRYGYYLATDGTNLYAIARTGASTAAVYTVNQSTGAKTLLGNLPSSIATTVGAGGRSNFTYGAFDRGTAYYYYTVGGVQTALSLSGTTFSIAAGVQPLPALHYANSEGRFYDPGGSVGYYGGSTWPDGRYASTTPKKFSKNTDTTPLWITTSWYNGTTGHETLPGPVLKATPMPYYGVKVTRPVPSTAGGSGDVPQTARVYAARGATQPALSTFGTLTGDTDSGPVTDLDVLLGSSRHPVSVATFPNGNSALLQSDAGGFVVKGDGSGDWPLFRSSLQVDMGKYMPIGSIIMYGGVPGSLPNGWFACEGGTLSRSAYPELYAVIGDRWNAGTGADGTTTYGLPDFRDRFPLGGDGNHAIGSTGGSNTITAANMPSHSHNAANLSTDNSGSHSHTVNTSSAQGANTARVARGTTDGAGAIDAGINGGAHSHNVTGTTGTAGSGTDYWQPFAAPLFIIKAYTA